MPAPTVSLDVIQIPEPCEVPWDEMVGDDTRRYCERCGVHVHNLAAMERRDAEALVQAARRGRVCVQMRRGADGRVLTREDRPAPGRFLRGHRRRRRAGYSNTVTLVGLLALAVLVLSAAGVLASRETQWREKLSRLKAELFPPPSSPPPIVLGSIAPLPLSPMPVEAAGDIELPEPIAPPTNPPALRGEAVIPPEACGE